MPINDFLDFLESIRKESGENEDFFNAVYHRGEYDLTFFNEFFFPHFCTHEANLFHKEFDCVASQKIRGYRRAWAAPRGSAKSVRAACFKPIHDTCYGLEKFIVIISNTDPLAVSKLKDIRDEVLSNELLRYVYGIHFDVKKPGAKEYYICTPKGKVYFKCFGGAAQVRGVRYGAHRPSKIIIDDLEHSEKVYSERQREKTLNFVNEDVTKAGNEKTNIEIVGTILHQDSMLAGMEKNPTYQFRKYKSVIEWSKRQDLWDKWEHLYMDIKNPNRLEESEQFYNENKEEMLQGTKVLWHDKEPYLYLMKELMEIGKRSFFKEKQNNPLSADDVLFDRIWWYQEKEDHFYIEMTGEKIYYDKFVNSAYGALDPAAGQSKPSQSKKTDFSCLVTGLKCPSGRIFVHHDITKRISPTKQINSIFDCHEKFDYEKFAVETNLFRNLLMQNIMEEKKRREQKTNKIIRIPFYDVVNTENKEKRIYRLEPKIHHGWLLFNRKLSKDFQIMLESYPYSDHDDAPDVLEILYNLVHNCYKIGNVNMNLMD